jgi:hypothetical protein
LITSFIGAIAFYFSTPYHGESLQKNPLNLEAVAERKEQILLLFKRLF